MKVKNMTNSRGDKVANQFVITGTEHYYINGTQYDRDIEVFQSYSTTIAKKHYACDTLVVTLDRYKWNYSRTTSRYRNQFLGETTKETQAKIDSGEYILANLN